MRYLLAIIIFTICSSLEIFIKPYGLAGSIHEREIERIDKCTIENDILVFGSSGTYYLFEGHPYKNVDVLSAPGIYAIFLLDYFMKSGCYKELKKKPKVVLALSPDIILEKDRVSSSFIFKHHELRSALLYFKLPNAYLGLNRFLKTLWNGNLGSHSNSLYPPQKYKLNEVEISQRIASIDFLKEDKKSLLKVLSRYITHCSSNCIITIAPVYKEYYSKLDLLDFFDIVAKQNGQIKIDQSFISLSAEQVGDTLEHIDPNHRFEIQEKIMLQLGLNLIK